MTFPYQRFKRAKYAVIVVVSSILFLSGLIALPLTAVAAPQQSTRALQPADMQNLIFVWASGTTAIQQQALHLCQTDGITPAHCAAISADVRGAWLALMQVDPASLGRPGVPEHSAARTQVYRNLAAQLAALTGNNVTMLLTQTQQVLRQVDATLLQENTAPSSAGATLHTVWATSFTQNPLPDGLKPKTSPYVALPDAYLKYANWGQISNIPSIYLPYYAPAGKKTFWSVNIFSANGTKKISKVLVTDAGPWNEDDNWWDANGTSATLPASCPVSSTLIAPDATSNPLVNGICPDGKNLRRIYYYLLYTHDGLPFFQPPGYSPSGNFADGSLGTWPTALPQDCSESTGASLNNDGITCGGGADGYNANNGGWLREGTYNQGITNQSSIDLSPAVNKALGWTYPSSGLVQVNVNTLP